ncbi:cytochrome c maturation protein CcmE [Legionella fairfieldensis]|uniref:cytochrome c maturation protein CcmE n=1 Tax=Legionella fairfieldensis TaxID=45064 RepID=UPI00048F2F98|nr:cytochrome c maturation protein CcmE [Legionella fairfieldensis]
MNPVRKRKIQLIVFIGSIIGIVSALILFALRQNINLFYTPTQIVHQEAPLKHRIRVGGMVVKGSVVRGADDLSVQFRLTDFKETIIINHEGILPDLFREGQGIVALGELTDNQHFIAEEVLAKHDANYMPPEVKDALAKTTQSGVKKST